MLKTRGGRSVRVESKIKQFMFRRIEETKENLQVNTQLIRSKLLESLESQFEIADNFAKRLPPFRSSCLWNLQDNYF